MTTTRSQFLTKSNGALAVPGVRDPWSATSSRSRTNRAERGPHPLRSHAVLARDPLGLGSTYLSEKPGWQLMFVPRAMVILDASKQPGRPLQPWKDELAAARASSLTTVPTVKKTEHAPEPLPAVMVQSMPAGCEVMRRLPFPPGIIERLP